MAIKTLAYDRPATTRPPRFPHDFLVRAATGGARSQLGVPPRRMLDGLPLLAGTKAVVDALPEGLSQVDALSQGQGHQLFR